MKTSIFLLAITFVAVFSSASGARNPKCTEPIQAGRCQAYFPKFGYNAEKGECVQFIYGGCGSNGNNFNSKSDCEKACKT